jgi:hypothetical protein
MANYYGSFVEALMYADYTSLNECGAAYDGHVNKYNRLVDDYNSLLGSYKGKASLEKKLRKACGAKCKRVK